MAVSKNNGTPKSSILIGFSIIFTIHLGYPYLWKHPYNEPCNGVSFNKDSRMPSSPGFREPLDEIDERMTATKIILREGINL